MYKIIIADDDDGFLRQFKKIIDWEKYEFQIIALANDGEEIIQYLKSYSIDAVITDIMMPEKTGLEVAKYIYENNLGVKIVFFSAYRDFDFAAEALKYNVQGYITKPISFSQVNEILTKLKDSLNSKNTTNQFIDESMILSRRKLINSYLFSNKEFDDNMIKKLLSASIQPRVYYFKCAITVYKIIDYNNYIEKTWKHGELMFRKTFLKMISFDSEDYHVITLTFSDGIAVNIIVSKNQNVDLKQALSDIKNRINDVFSLDTEDIAYTVKENFTEMKQYVAENKAKDIDFKELWENERDYEQFSKDAKKIDEFIEANYKRNITKKDISDELYMSKATLDRFFAIQIKSSFSDYLNKMRVEKAKQLLSDRMIPLENIHNMLGYNSRSHFCKIFKQYTGISPLEYRKKGEL